MGKRDIPLLLLAITVLLAGINFFLAPSIHRLQQKSQSEQTVSEFFHDHPQATALTNLPDSSDEDGESESTEPQDRPYADLLAAMQAYNEEIYANGQAGLSDPWAYTGEVLDLSEYGLESETVAVLTIPKMNLSYNRCTHTLLILGFSRIIIIYTLFICICYGFVRYNNISF